MRIFRSVMMTTLAVVALLAAATPTFAQSTPAQPVVKQQGLGIFVQGGYINQSLYTGGDEADFSPQGFIAGIGFGGNKSGAFGMGVDVNYMWNTFSEGSESLRTQSLDIPVYGRFNIGGHNTKNAFTFYIPVGWFFDFNLSSKVEGEDVGDFFESFQTGPMVGAGMEFYRFGIEGRAQWAVTQLFKGEGAPDSKQFTFIVLFKARLN